MGRSSDQSFNQINRPKIPISNSYGFEADMNGHNGFGIYKNQSITTNNDIGKMLDC